MPVLTPTKKARQKFGAQIQEIWHSGMLFALGSGRGFLLSGLFFSFYLYVCLCVKGTDLRSGHIHCEQHVQKTCRTPRHLLSRSPPVGPLPSCDRDAGLHTHTLACAEWRQAGQHRWARRGKRVDVLWGNGSPIVFIFFSFLLIFIPLLSFIHSFPFHSSSFHSL